MSEEIRGVLVVPLIIAVVSAARAAGFPSKFAGLLAVALGLAIAAGAALTGGLPLGPDSPAPPADWFTAALRGTAYGLAAAGLYSGAKAAVRVQE